MGKAGILAPLHRSTSLRASVLEEFTRQAATRLAKVSTAHRAASGGTLTPPFALLTIPGEAVNLEELRGRPGLVSFLRHAG